MPLRISEDTDPVPRYKCLRLQIYMGRRIRPPLIQCYRSKEFAMICCCNVHISFHTRDRHICAMPGLISPSSRGVTAQPVHVDATVPAILTELVELLARLLKLLRKSPLLMYSICSISEGLVTTSLYARCKKSATHSDQSFAQQESELA